MRLDRWSQLVSVTIGGYILVVVSACTAANLSGQRRSGDVPTVTYCDLTGRPDFYDKKVVRVRAVLYNSFEQRYLYDLVCKLGETPKAPPQTPAETWVDFDPSFDIKGDTQEAKRNREIFGFGRVDITAIGRFQTSHDAVRFGHLGCCQHQLVVMKVEAAAPQTNN
jgi:hypothetical protein